MTTWRRPVTILALLGALAGAAAAPAAAQDASSGSAAEDPSAQVVESWALAPGGAQDAVQPGNRPNLTYTAPAGSTLEDSVTLFNYSNVPLTFRVYGSDAFNTEDGGFDVLAGDEPTTDVGSWVTVPMEELTLQAGEQATLPITITIPADATPGDHVGAVIASSRAEGTGADGKVVALDRRTGTRLYLRVAGPVEPMLQIEGVSVSYSPSINPLGGSATVTYTVANRGNVRLGGTSYVSVGGPFGLLGKDSSPEELTELLPGESVTYTTTLDGVPATVVSSATVHLDPVAATGDEDTLSSDSQGALTLALPWTLLAIVVVVGLVLFAWRRYRRRQGDGTAPGGPQGGRPGPAEQARPLERQPA